MKRTIILLGSLLGICALTPAQINRNITVTPGEKIPIAVPDFRGAGDAQALMNTFNSTLWSELQNSGQLKMIPKTSYPLTVPQQPSDFHPPMNGKNQGPWMTDWSGPPVNGRYLAFGYTATQNGQLVL